MREVRNTNVCVIGGAGFIGSHLVDYLIENRNCNVIVLDNLITGQTKNINKSAKFIYVIMKMSSQEYLKKIILNMFLTMLPSHTFQNVLKGRCTSLILMLRLCYGY
jgi:UDP-glucose 4-epimerase